MLARLLRKTIGALNTSSETMVESNNMRECWAVGPGELKAEGQGSFQGQELWG